MKMRTDFVSNSSSSSFICTANDACGIELFNTSEQLSLHEYLERFGAQDVLYGEWWSNDKRKMKFVSDDELCRKFASGILYTLPFSAKEAYENDPEDWKAMMPYVEDALRPVWGDVKLEYYEAEDCSSYGPQSDEDYWSNNEESFLLNVFGHSKMKFSRVFNNH